MAWCVKILGTFSVQWTRIAELTTRVLPTLSLSLSLFSPTKVQRKWWLCSRNSRIKLLSSDLNNPNYCPNNRGSPRFIQWFVHFVIFRVCNCAIVQKNFQCCIRLLCVKVYKILFFHFCGKLNSFKLNGCYTLCIDIFVSTAGHMLIACIRLRSGWHTHYLLRRLHSGNPNTRSKLVSSALRLPCDIH